MWMLRALFEDINAAGIGIVIRKSHGGFVAAKCRLIQEVTDPLRAEFLAARKGLLFAWDMGCRNVHLEGDSKTVFDRFND